MQPLLVGIILEHQLPALQVVYHSFDDLVIHGGAPVASPDAAVFADPVIIHVVGAMNHDGALPGKIIDPRLKTIEPERVTVFSEVGFPGLEKADAGLMAALHIGESSRFKIPGVLAVCNKITQQQLFLLEVKDPKPLLTGGQRKIDNRQALGHLNAAGHSATGSIDRCLENHSVNFRRGFTETIKKLLIKRSAKR